MRALGVALAAGRSTRFGAEDKLLAPLGGTAVAAYLARAMKDARLDYRAVVTRAPKVARSFQGYTVLPPEGGDDQAASLAAAVAHARELGADRLLVALADMPLVTTAMLDAVLSACGDDCGSASRDGARRSPPACFPAVSFDRLSALKGDQGARNLLAELPERAIVIAPAGSLADIDTPSDLAALQTPTG